MRCAAASGKFFLSDQTKASRNVNIDVHAHYVPQSLLDDLKAQKRLFPSVKTQEEKGLLALAFCGGTFTRPVMGRLSDIAHRKTWLAEQRIDKQVVGGWLDMFAYELPAEEGADWSRFLLWKSRILRSPTVSAPAKARLRSSRPKGLRRTVNIWAACSAASE